MNIAAGRMRRFTEGLSTSKLSLHHRDCRDEDNLRELPLRELPTEMFAFTSENHRRRQLKHILPNGPFFYDDMLTASPRLN